MDKRNIPKNQSNMEEISAGKARLIWVDYVKGICMFTVILNYLYVPDIYYRFTYPFELVGFFFASGYTFSTKNNWRIFISNKLKSLVFPIISLGTINCFFSWVVKGTNIGDYILGLVMQVPGQWDDLWFVACLFIMEIIFYLIVKAISSNLYRFSICFLLFLVGYCLLVAKIGVSLPWHIQNACIFIPCLWGGYVCRRAYKGQMLFKYLTENHPWGTLIVAALCHVIAVFAYDNSHVDVHLLQFGHFIAFFFSAMTGLTMVVCGAVMLEACRKNFFLKALSFVGMNTFVYYAFQSKVISGLFMLTAKSGIQYNPYVSSIIYCIVICCLLSIPVYIIKRFFPFLLRPALK